MLPTVSITCAADGDERGALLALAQQLVATRRDIAEVTGPGTTMSSRPSFRARRAVACAPDRAAASTTTVPRVSAAISRLRTRKRCRSGAQPGGHSLTSRPVSAIRPNSAPWAAG